MLENIKAVLFDLDGTLVDSMWMWGDIDREYLGRHGLPLPDDLQQHIEGMSFSETARYFKERFQLEGTLEEIKSEWNDMAKDKYANEVFLKPGAGDFLHYLKEHGIRTGIATSNSRELLEALMDARDLWRYFDCCLTSCDAGAGKPAPDVYLDAACKVGVEPRHCLVFEDTLAGVRSGMSAGMKVCAVADAYAAGRRQEIRSLADYYIESFEQIADGTYERLDKG